MTEPTDSELHLDQAHSLVAMRARNAGLLVDDDLHALVMLIGVLAWQGDTQGQYDAAQLVEVAVDLFLTGAAMLP
ncbi:MAG: hypothetical protein QOJ66_1831 [Ilumatobacteraceae bacterium]|jgi:hypothetical protein